MAAHSPEEALIVTDRDVLNIKNILAHAPTDYASRVQIDRLMKQRFRDERNGD